MAFFVNNIVEYILYYINEWKINITTKISAKFER